MARISAPPSTGGSRPVSPVMVWLAVVLFLALIIGLTHVFGPDKPATPRNSEVKYTSYEDPKLAPANFGPSASGRSPVTDTEGEEAEGRLVAAKESDPIRLTGTVTDADTNEPIANSTITVTRFIAKEEHGQLNEAHKAALTEESKRDSTAPENAEPGPAMKRFKELDAQLTARREATTDSKGEYRIGLPSPGGYVADPKRSGYLLQEVAGVTVREGQTDVRLDIKMKRGATISGRVTERGTSQGAVNVGVSAYTEPFPEMRTNNARGISRGNLAADAGMFPSYAYAKTDSKGNFKLVGLAPGDCTVSLTIGEAAYRFTGLPPTRLVQIRRLGDDVQNINFVVEPAGMVWGYVLDETGAPVKGADVIQCYSDSIIAQVAEAATHLRPPIHSNSDSEGMYRLFGPPLNRECRVFVMANEHSPQISDPFVLTSSNREVRVDVYLSAGSTVHGRVVSREGKKPIARAQIQCIPAVSRIFSPFDAAMGFRDATSNRDGTFEIAHLPVGEHRIYAQAKDYKLSLVGEPAFSDGFSDIQLEIVLDPVDRGEHTVFGTVKNSAGRPVPDAHLALISLSLENLQQAAGGRETTSDAKGNYLFSGVETGSPLLMVEAQGYSPARVDKVQLDSATDVELVPTARVSGRVVIRETSQPPLSCTVRAFPTSTPQGDLLSSLQSLEGHVAQCTDGAFTLELPEGEYTLVANPQGASPGRLQVSVGAGEQVDGLVIQVSEQGGRIAGRVTVRDGKSPAGATVMLGQEGGSFAELMPMMEDLQVRSTQVNEDGSFEFTRLAGGAYRLTAHLEGYAEGHSNPVVLQDGQSVTGVEIVLGSGGRLQGTVVIGGEVAPGAVVTISGTGFNRVVTADRNGQYLIEGIPPGQYLAAAINPTAVASGHFAPSHGQVVIQDGQTTQYNFGDAQGATVEGLCTPPPGLGNLGFAILRIAGTGDDVSQLDFRSLTSWFTGDMSSVPYVVGLAQLDADGWFQIENAPEGSYSLDVYYLTLGNLMTSHGRRVFSTMVDITGKNTVSLQIAVSQ